MAESPGPDVETETDPLSQLQRKLDDIGVMFYTYVGILQRDAPPVARAPDDDVNDPQEDIEMRKNLAEKTPDFAKDIVRTNKEIDEIIDQLEKELQVDGVDEKAFLQEADAASVAAGGELESAALQATKLLADVRSVIAARDQDDVPAPVQ